MHCKILRGAPGDGKSVTMINTMLANPGRYLLATPRINLVEEQVAYLRANRPVDKYIAITPVHCEQKQRAKVERRLREVLIGHAATPHAIVAVTHETLLKTNPDLLSGWHVGIDEIPDGAVRGGTFEAATTWPSLAHYYKLVPVVGGRWWQVQPRDGVDQPSPGMLARDGHGLLPFHTAARDPRRPLLVDLGDWEEARAPGRRVGWYSPWMLTDLSACASVTIAAASFGSSLVYHAHRHLPAKAITFEEVRVRTALRARPSVRLHYFCTHRGSTMWWETTEGERCLVGISEHLERIGFDGYWSCNAEFRLAFQHRLKELWRKPRQSGTNSLREHTSCAILYSNKAQSADDPVLDALGLDRRAIIEAREYEDLWQFIMRGAVRDPTYGGSYDAYVYSRDQAEALQLKLIDSGITDDVTLVPVDEAGLLDVVRPRAAVPEGERVADKRSLQEHREQKKLANRELKRRTRAAKREEQERTGTLRARGRPRKQTESFPVA